MTTVQDGKCADTLEKLFSDLSAVSARYLASFDGLQAELLIKVRPGRPSQLIFAANAHNMRVGVKNEIRFTVVDAKSNPIPDISPYELHVAWAEPAELELTLHHSEPEPREEGDFAVDLEVRGRIPESVASEFRGNAIFSLWQRPQGATPQRRKRARSGPSDEEAEQAVPKPSEDDDMILDIEPAVVQVRMRPPHDFSALF